MSGPANVSDIILFQCAVVVLFEQVIGCDLSMPSFGVCYIKDMLMEVSDSQVVLSGAPGDQALISIPKKGMVRLNIIYLIKLCQLYPTVMLFPTTALYHVFLCNAIKTCIIIFAANMSWFGVKYNGG